MSDVPFSEMIDRVRRRIEAGIILVEQRFSYHVESLGDAVVMIELLIELERTKERVQHEKDRKRKPQKKRPPGVFARDIPAAKDIEVPARDTANAERPYPAAAFRDCANNGSLASGVGEDRTTCDAKDNGATQ